MAASSCSPRRAAGARSGSQSSSRQRSAHSAWRSSGETRIAAASLRRRATERKLRPGEALDKGQHRREEVAVLVDTAQHVGGLEGRGPRAACAARTSSQVTGVDTVGRRIARSE